MRPGSASTAVHFRAARLRSRDTRSRTILRKLRIGNCSPPRTRGCGSRSRCILKRVKSILSRLHSLLAPAYRTAAVQSSSPRGSLPPLLRLHTPTFVQLWRRDLPKARQPTSTSPPRRILQPVLPTLAADFERQTGTHILSTFGSSATLTQQIQNGAPVDVFLSADCAHPQQLADAHLTADSKPVQYADRCPRPLGPQRLPCPTAHPRLADQPARDADCRCQRPSRPVRPGSHRGAPRPHTSARAHSQARYW